MRQEDCTMGENPWSGGYDFWFVADPEHSLWARKIDWYLNFQLMKANRHQPLAIAPELQAIAQKNEMDVPALEMLVDPSYLRLPLLLACGNLLPVRTLIVVPFSESAESQVSDWSRTCLKIWQNLNRPKVRVFLPNGVGFEDFRADWHQEFAHDIDLVRAVSPEGS